MRQKRLIQLPSANSFLARRILFNAKEYALSTVRIDGDRVIISPFVNETHSTAYIDGTIEVEVADGKVRLYEIY